MRALCCFLLFIIASAAQAKLPRNAEQLVVGLADSWGSPSGTLYLCEKTQGKWHVIDGPLNVRYGRAGLAWGRGVAGQNEPGPQKIERDKRSPAGLFRIGRIFTYEKALPSGADYPFHTVTERDAWVDDPNLPEHYNRHIIVEPGQEPPWFNKQRMRLNDYAHHWMIEIRHNADPPVVGLGSAIFFHIWRGENVSSSGCTVLSRENILRIIRWLRADKHPHYLLLPRAEYERYWKSWNLPPPSLFANP